MSRKPLTTRRTAGAGIGPRIALALAAGAVIGAALPTSPAQAQLVEQRQQRQGGPSLSREFQPVYVLVAEATNTTGDLPAARAQVPALIAAIGSEYDRFFAGSILLQLGSKSSDKTLQRQGLELMLASGQASPENIGLFRFYLGGFAYDEQRYEVARTELQASIAAGFQGNFAERQDPWGLIAESYFKEARYPEGLAYLGTAIDQRKAAGQQIPELWLVRPLAVAYEQGLTAEAVDAAVRLVEISPNATNWAQSLQVLKALSQDDKQVQLDVFRLMSQTNSLSDRADYIRYIEAADPRIMSNEVATVLAAAVQAGALTEADEYYVDVKRLVDENAAKDRADAPGLATEARAASGTARAAQNAGDVLLSLGAYAEAEEMFALGLQKGGADRDRLLTRLGIAQAHQGKNAEAKATFAQVTGDRSGIARLWAAYLATRA